MRRVGLSGSVGAAWLGAAVVLGALQAVAFRTSMNPDGIAYLDMGDAYLRGDWATAIRSHWSPLYAWLLGVALRLVQPAPAAEFPLVHLVNLLIFVLAAGAFALLMREVVRTASGVPEWATLSLGWATFLWCTLQYTPLGLVTPDLLVAALVFAVAAVILRTRHTARRRDGVLIGLLLGLAYLAKTPMLPLAVAFLFAAVLASGRQVPRTEYLLSAAGGFAVLAVPFVLALSIVNGRLTAGDSAVLNYLWRIDGLPVVHWLGDGGPEGIGQPVHHSLALLQRPMLFSFDSPFAVTYSPWFAPEYWFVGAQPVFDMAAQLGALGDAAIVYGRLVSDLGIPLAALGVLLVIQHGARGSVRSAAVLLVPAAAAFALFAPVLVEERYVAPFAVLTVLGLLMLIRLRLAGLAVLAAAVLLAVQLASTVPEYARPASTDLRHATLLEPDEQALVATALQHELGLQPGDAVVAGNRGFNAYWARLARLRIVAEVAGYDGTTILESDPDARSAAQQVLLAQPGRAIVAYGWPSLTGDPAWQPIDGTGYFFRRLP
jgi:hypothetical protein